MGLLPVVFLVTGFFTVTPAGLELTANVLYEYAGGTPEQGRNANDVPDRIFLWIMFHQIADF